MSIAPCTVKTPSDCAPSELDEVVALVLAGREVLRTGLRERVRQAHSLAFLRTDGCLIGVAGLKIPSENHRTEVSIGASITLAAGAFPLELGWVYVLPSARGGKSHALCAPLVVAAQGRGMFATARAGNKAMHATLVKLGFLRRGGEWPSGQNPDNLWLYLKPAAGLVDTCDLTSMSFESDLGVR